MLFTHSLGNCTCNFYAQCGNVHVISTVSVAVYILVTYSVWQCTCYLHIQCGNVHVIYTFSGAVCMLR